MKIRKISATVLSVLLLAAAMAGCSSKTSFDAGTDKYYSAETAGSGIYDTYDTVKEEVSNSSSGDISLTDRKLIKTVDMDVETEDLDALLTALTARVSQLQGYVESQRVYNGSAYDTYRSRSASMTVRIPADSLKDFIDHVADNTNIISQYSDIDDVTLTYVATESRVNALQAEEARLLELMGKAETMSDLLEVEARLTDVRYELERVTSQLQILENQVSYSTVNLNIDEVKEYTPVEEETFWQRISGGFMDSLRGIGDGVVELTVWFLSGLPYLLLLGGITAVIVILIRRSLRKKKARNRPQENP